MSYSGNTSNQFQAIVAGDAYFNRLYINGVRFRDYVQSLISEDQLEQQEIDHIRNLLTYLDTSALTQAWVINNDNRNAILKTAIDLINTRLQYYDGTALTESWVVNNDNINSVLKTRIDGHDTNLTSITNKTRYVSSVQGNNTEPKVASDFQVNISDRDKRRIYMTTGANQISCINNSLTQSTQGETTDNQIVISAPNGMVQTTGYLNSIRGGDTIEITGYGGMNIQASPNIKIGNKGAQILIGSEDTPEVGQTNTVIKIGKRTITRNTETRLQGNMLIAEARFTELSTSPALTWTNFLALISTNGMPAYIASAILTSAIPNYVYSDFLVMKGAITKDGDLETTTTPKMKGYTVFDSSVGIDILPKVQTFLAKGDISETTLIGSIRQQTFNGEILLRNNNILATNIDWALTDAMDKVNALKLSNNDCEFICGGGANNSQLRISNTCTNGKMRFRMGSGGLQSNATDALSIYNDPTAGTSQVLIAGNSVPSYYDTNTKLLVDHQFLNNGIRVSKQGIERTTLINNDNINTPSLTLQTNWGGTTTNTLYLNASNQLMYNGTQVGSGTSSGFQTGGIIYLLQGPTTSVVYTAANLTTQLLTAGESYVGSAQKSIKLTTYNAGTTYNLYTHRGSINKITNPVIKGIWEYVINLSYSGNQPASVYVDAYFFGDVYTGSSSVLRKIYAAGDAVGTGSLGVGQDSFTPYWVINKYQFQFIFTSVEFSLVNYRGVNCVFRCTLEDDLQTVLYTFPDITRTSASSGQNFSVESLTFTAPSQQTITQGFLFTGKKLRFRFRFVSGTSSGGFSVFYNQPSAAGVNNLAFRVPSPGSYSTPISLNQTNLKALQFDGPLMREYELSVPIEEFDLTLFENPKFDLKFNFIQPSGTTSNHFIEAFFNDGSLSHCHTALNITSSIPSLRQVMQVQGDTDVNMYFFGGAGIQNVAFITDTLGITYSVKAITAGSGINVSSTPQGIYTINTVPAPLVWDNDIKINNGTTALIQMNPTLTTSLDINNYVYEVQIETYFTQAPPYLMISFNEVFTNLATTTTQSRHGFSSTLTRLNNPTIEVVSGEIYINNNASWYCGNQGEMLIHGYIRPLRSTQNGGSGTNNQNLGVLFHGASWYNRKNHALNNSPIEAWSHSSFSKIVYATPLIDRINNPTGNFANINYISLNTDNIACMRSLRIRTRIHSTIDRN